MIAHFVNVLVPVNLHSKDDKTIEIAIHMADPRFCVIHLLDIVRPTILSSVFGRASEQEIAGVGVRRFVKDMLQMDKLKTVVERSRPNSTVKIHICKGSNFSEVIAWYANRLCAQVVVVPRMESKGGFLLQDIAARTHCKILMYKDGILSIVEKSDPFVNDLSCGDVKRKASHAGTYFSVN
jgi:hypothetical protein